ncbi:chemotaxis protein CheB [Lysobacter sp. F60174L2]|uniref:chemotaxis protein CheB n=1 Tax=Lysobacter sp. F60174L2 TaxID=3459295 RepID=UPI00403D8B7B
MEAEALRVALLARPGVACDRLRGALEQSGARQVLEADPTELELPALVVAAPQVVLVALDPATENVLDRFDDVLFDPAVDVIYEEAELTASREGWDVARWQRHLVAKLQRHGDVLPPGREPDEVDAAASAPAAVPAIAPAIASQDVAGFESDPAASVESAGLQAETADPAPTAEAPAADYNAFDPVMAEFDSGPDAGIEAGTGYENAFVPVAAGIPELSLPTDDEPVEAEAVEAEPSPSADAAMEPSGPETAETTSDPAPASRFGNLTLDDGNSDIVAESHEANHKFKRDLSDLESRISGLELVDDTPVRGPEQASGAVLVLAGIGGPDAVRQLLGALPAEFARPVLIQQRLDGARYDKLVAQMQRATQAPVQLAVPGQTAHAGFVYILPADVGVDVASAGIRFNEGGELLSALPSADSAVLLLSGSDPALVDAVMKHSWAGALVAGQAADGCYDAAAANALAARGGDTAPAVELAQRLSERWP